MAAPVGTGDHQPANQGRAADLDAWVTMPPSVTAFVTFVADVDGRFRTTPQRAVDAAADALAAWTQHVTGMTLVWRGTDYFIAAPADSAHELRASAALDEQHALWQLSEDPRRARLVDFGFRAKGFLQVIDEHRSAEECLPDLMAGLRVLAPFVELAWVRRATTAMPHERDAKDALGRPVTVVEDSAAGLGALHLLHDYTVDAFVAQVLTSVHLARVRTLDDFVVEDLGNDRHLVVAREPDRWLTALNPDEDVLEGARRGFGDALLTPEIIAADEASRGGPRPSR